MTRWVFVAVVIVSATAATLTAGEGFLTKLPAPGTWVKYAVTQEQKREGSEDIRQSGELTVRYLDADSEAEKPCRWLEFHLDIAYAEGMSRSQEIDKFLIPTTSLTGEADPGQAVLRGWQWHDTDTLAKPPARLPDFFTAWYLTPPLAERQVRESKREISYQRGSLAVDQLVRGQTEWRSPAGMIVSVQHEHWPQADVPNGLAGARLETRMVIRDQLRRTIITEYSVTDFGTGATSQLPNDR